MEFLDDYSVRVYTLKNEFDKLLKLSRKGDEETQKSLCWLLSTTSEETPVPDVNDEQWISALASKLFYPAMYVYLNGKNRTYKRWKETVVTEDTNEAVEVERKEVLSETPLFNVPQDVREKLVQRYFDEAYADRESWFELAEYMTHIIDDFDLAGIGFDRAQQYLEMLEKLAKESDDMHWYEEICRLYYNGRPELGIFRNNAKSREYYQQAIASDKCTRKWAEYNKFYNEPFEHDKTGSRGVLRIKATTDKKTNITNLINDLCQKFGTPDNEFGMYVPFEQLIQTLVGSNEYYGNVLYLEEENDILALEADYEYEADRALLYALKKKFGSIKITIEEKDW